MLEEMKKEGKRWAERIGGEDDGRKTDFDSLRVLFGYIERFEEVRCA